MKLLLSPQCLHLFSHIVHKLEQSGKISLPSVPGLVKSTQDLIGYLVSEEPNPSKRSNTNNNAPSTYFIDAKIA
jgi:hypothetical protein